MMQPECGDGNFEPGEACDDGNLTDGDGCAANCTIEGSCSEPIGLMQTTDTASRIEWAISSTTGGESQVGLAACDGGPLGAGSDRVYTFTTTDTRDVTVTLSLGFSGLVRVMSQVCDTASEVVALGGTDGCSTGDVLEYRDLAAGSYFVVVDGQGARDAGGFDLRVRADCPTSLLGLSEMRIGLPDRASFMNNAPGAGCSVDLDGLSVQMGWTGGTPVDTALTGVLAPGDQLVVSDMDGDGDFYTGVNVIFDTSKGNYAALCRGGCAQAEDVIDVVASSEGMAHPTLPGGTAFSPEGLQGIVTGIDDNHLSYQRAATMGSSPTFLKSDWAIGPFLPTLFYDSFEDGNFDGWTIANLNIPYGVMSGGNGQQGEQALDLSGNSGTYTGFSTSFAAVQPTTITFRVRAVPTNFGFVGWVMMGDSNLTGNDGILQTRLGDEDAYVTSKNGSVVIPITPNTWVRFEYNNINWNKKTLDLVIRNPNNTKIHEAFDLPFWHQGTNDISRIHAYNTSDGFAYFDGFTLTQ